MTLQRVLFNTATQAVRKSKYLSQDTKISQMVEDIASRWKTVSQGSQSKALDKIQNLESKYSKDVKKLNLNGKEQEFVIYNGSCSGSNEGYWAKVKGTNDLYYIKYPQSEAHARSEKLAGDLYELAGVDSAKVSLVDYTVPSKTSFPWDRATKKVGVASKYLSYDGLPTKADAPLLREGFGADCWLANWDALKSGNTVMKGGKPLRLDVGGSLCYRARGGRKGAAFGQDVTELSSFFEAYSQSRPYLQDMTRGELIESLSRVAMIPEKQIADTIEKASYTLKTVSRVPVYLKDKDIYAIGGSGEAIFRSGIKNPEYLKETLIERKKYIASFMLDCIQTPQKVGESIGEYIKRVQFQMPKTEYKLPFDKIKMSAAVKDGDYTLAECLTPSQKRLYESSYDSYLSTKGSNIAHPKANDILTEDVILHSASPKDLVHILDDGITSGDLRGAVGTGTGVATQTPLCADFWDVRKTSSIKDYFSKPVSEFNQGELNFLPHKKSSHGEMVFVVDKKAVNKTIMDNSFKVNRDLVFPDTILDLDGNMQGHFGYISHRAIPYGVPANSIDRIIIPKENYSDSAVSKIKQIIQKKGLDIKLYDLDGNLL